MQILKYLRKKIGKNTLIESKSLGQFTGKIIKIDNNMNLTIKNAIIKGKDISQLILRGSDIRSFELKEKVNTY